MKRVSFYALPALAAAFAIAAAPLPLRSSETVVRLPRGTSVQVSFAERVSSDSATQGSIVAVHVDKEVDVDGVMLIRKGAQGQATLTNVLQSGGYGSGGKVEFNVNWVYSVDGGKVALLAIKYATWNFARGRAAVINTDNVFHVFVDHTVHVTTGATRRKPRDSIISARYGGETRAIPPR